MALRFLSTDKDVDIVTDSRPSRYLAWTKQYSRKFTGVATKQRRSKLGAINNVRLYDRPTLPALPCKDQEYRSCQGCHYGLGDQSKGQWKNHRHWSEAFVYVLGMVRSLQEACVGSGVWGLPLFLWLSPDLDCVSSAAQSVLGDWFDLSATVLVSSSRQDLHTLTLYVHR